MEFTRHDRVKRIFLGALECREDERPDYLRIECGADRELLQEVETLLDAHRQSTVIFVDPRSVPTPQSQWRMESLSRLFDVLAFLSKNRSRRLLVLGVAVGFVLAIGYWARARAEAILFTQTASALRAVLDSNAAALSTMLADLQSQVGGIVQLSTVTATLNGLISARRSEEWRRSVSIIEPLLSGLRHHSFFVVDRAGELVATSEGLRSGMATPSGLAVLARVNRGRTFIQFPGPRPDFGESHAQGVLWPRITVFSPVREPDGRIAGAFALVLPVDRLAQRLVRGRPLQSGETYLFTKEGLLLTPPLFREDLERWKLIQPTANPRMAPAFYLRDPGRSLYDSNGLRPGEDFQSWPLTQVVRVATARREHASAEATGLLMSPYRDYRGTWVVSSWWWSTDTDVGLVTEVDEREIASALRFLEWPIGLFTLLLLGAGIWTIFSSALLMRLRRRTLAGEALGQYVLLDKLGEGGGGEVFLAQHAFLRCQAAVKLLRRDRLGPVFLQQFEHEAKAASRLRHPNTVQIYDFGRARDGTPYYVMEYVPGLDLGRVVSQYGAMAPARAVHIATQICAALQEAHQAGVIHRDIKPANVMLCALVGQYDFVKILDFGLAKDITLAGEATSLNVRSGTPYYTAPERLLPAAEVDHRCDIYSLGVLLYFLVCARTPFVEPDAYWVESVLTRDPIPPTRHVELPASVERIILDCMRREPGGRPGSAQELLKRFSRLDDVPRWTPEDAEAACAPLFAGSGKEAG